MMNLISGYLMIEIIKLWSGKSKLSSDCALRFCKVGWLIEHD
jgi:hypothetical protein